MTRQGPDAPDAEEGWLSVASAAELGAGTMMGVELGDLRVAIYNVDGAFFATENVCTHAFAILTDGWFEDGVVECPLHAGRFDVMTGEAQGDPVTCNLRVFRTRLVEDAVEVLLPAGVARAAR